MQLHYQEHPGNGPHLLLLHGFLSSNNQWRDNLQALADVCQPVTVELWGHHDSPAPTDPDAYRPDAYMENFEHIRCALGAEQWLLCGYSLGAGLTLRYAQEHPERTIAHAFTNSTSAMADAELLARWAQDMPASARAIEAKGQSALEKIAVHPAHGRKLPSDIKSLLVGDAKAHTPLGIANTLRYTNPLVSMRDRVGANERPALLLWGTKEKRFLASKEFAAANMPNLEIAPIEAGHGVNMEAPHAFNHALCDFIRKHTAAAA